MSSIPGPGPRAEPSSGIPVLCRSVADPGDFLRVHQARPDRYPFLLESAAYGTPHGRYDLLFGFPDAALTLDGEGRVSGPGCEPGDGFLQALDRWWASERGSAVPGDIPPFAGGWFLYLGYELAGEVEPTLRLPLPDGLPVALAVRMRAALVRDRVTGEVFIAAEGEELLEAVAADVEAAGDRPPPGDGAIRVGAIEEEPPSRFIDAVGRARDHIIAGEIFQANLSRAWDAELSPDTDPAVLYARLRRTNPGPFAGLARWGDRAVLSSSPERLISCDGRFVETRPIAGTRPRGMDDSSDAALSRELIAHPKERAEHVMLIDLERNDLGRICEPGSVEVNEMMVIESYAHVHHIVSNVRGELRRGVGPGEAIRAVFPGGTITGCPKVRCMEIIRDLEAGPRGPYTGSMGWLGRDGRMDLNILIRTIETGPGRARFRAGAGIVFDSVPEAELAETRAKARGLLLALGAEAGS